MLISQMPPIVSSVIQILISIASKNTNNQDVVLKPSSSLFAEPPKPEWDTFPRYISEVLDWIYDRDDCYVLALYYMSKLELDPSVPPITLSTVHRMFFACLSVAVKYLEDGRTKNSQLAKIGNVTIQELNQMELSVLLSLQFNCCLNEEKYTSFYSLVDIVLDNLNQNQLPKSKKGLSLFHHSSSKLTIQNLFASAEHKQEKLQKLQGSTNQFKMPESVKGFVSSLIGRSSSFNSHSSSTKIMPRPRKEASFPSRKK
eukprot:c13143_g1_i1.p1 GENE.c13143_g1_i1~~c13143_g1_i1.p1  ORF type:complete len:266 (-),score=74.86 c13143_g1_i1:17-787(-)